MSAVFDAYAAYYDLLYHDKNYQTESDFVHAQMTRHGVPTGGQILELGCGTGKHAECFARMGYTLHGVDMSPPMIDAANARKPADVAAQLKFTVGDVRDVRVAKQYDAVISLFHVASYQTTNTDLVAMFRTAEAHLKPGGVFLFDCWYGPAVLTDRPVVRVKRMSNETFDVMRIAEPVIYPNENKVDVNYTVQVKKKGAERVGEFSELHSMRYLFTPEVAMLLSQSGMNLVENLEWVTGCTSGFGSWTVTFIATKCK